MNIQLLWLTTALGLLDQFAKAWVVKHMASYDTRELFAGLSLERIHNHTGQQWLGFSSTQAALWVPLFGVGVIASFMCWLRMNKSEQRLTALAFAIIAGGVLANTADWAIYGYGIEFLRITWLEDSFGNLSYSLGDVMLFLGLLLYIIDSFIFDVLRKNNRAAFNRL